MTLPNRHLPNQIVHLTRRTSQRQFLLRPDKKGTIENDLGYLFALACLRHNQTPHALTLMCNHHHICMTDNNGKRSNFLRDFHHLTTKVVNRELNRCESLWSSSAPGNTLLLDTEAVINAMVYAWLNPVQAGLVSKVRDWGHLQILPSDWGTTMTFKRPAFFKAKGEDKNYPETIELTPMPPSMFERLPLSEVIAFFEKKIEEGENRIREERKKEGKPKAMGMKKCFALNPFSCPETPSRRSSRNPRFASSVVASVALAVEGMKTFWREYKARLEGFRKGSKAKFPSGTIRMLEIFHLICKVTGGRDPHQPSYTPWDLKTGAFSQTTQQNGTMRTR